ncbi:MAG TPA: hypothetical protein VHO69_10860 [Phototrophicaceae bacterium]|nr:hypothetical protein [Phototrophicaceae bacterium]
MPALLAVVQITTYFILLLLAAYLLNRSGYHPVGLSTAGALVAFALIQADQFFGARFEAQADGLAQLLWAVYPLPVALWARTTILLLPDENLMIDRIWWTLVLPIALLLILGGWLGCDLVNLTTHQPGQLYWIYALFNIVTILLTLWTTRQAHRQTAATDRTRLALYWLQLAGLAYGVVMVPLAFGLLSPAVVFSLVVLDVIVFGLSGIAYNAIAEGQSVWRDLMATLLKALALIGLVILPWGVAIWLAKVWSLAVAGASLISIGAIALLVPLQDELERLIDSILAPGQQDEIESRQTLRILLHNSVQHPVSKLTKLDRDEFARLTRRALSHLPNLPRLAASPLTELNLVTARVNADADKLQRAQALRRILIEGIDALRPAGSGDYGTTDEWRFFNALYYPYVAGLSPYQHSLTGESLTAETAEVTAWFRAMVPERTLHNWQNRGAALIADILLEHERLLSAS